MSVSDLAQISGRSLSSFNREFKSTYKMPPKQWLQEKRLSYSKELLQYNELSVTEIAMKVGYENVSHFIKAFKNRYGSTPKQLKVCK
ncbi:helix-turn-helix domain-containing protein [Motiliproteus sp. MSK22-1]|uniref:helix-turn-helix domain-containing protein n=1 Tax=Motiliproteus sp. MSK22-1 TaxID=1897630 RepID=UPI003513C173